MATSRQGCEGLEIGSVAAFLSHSLRFTESVTRSLRNTRTVLVVLDSWVQTWFGLSEMDRVVMIKDRQESR